MSRIIDVFEQFLDGNGEPLANGYLQFFQNKTAIPEPTYDDPDETILNPANVPLDGEGRLTLNIYGSVLYTVKKFNSVAVQKGSNDNVRPRGAADAIAGQLEEWDPTVFYSVDNLVKGDDGNFYQSLTDSNINNNPSDPSLLNWKEWSNITVWNVNVLYAVGNIAQTSNGNLWEALTATSGNDPETDDGTNWTPAIDGAKVPEIIALEALNSWDIPETADFTGVASEARQVDGSINTVDITLPALVIGDSFIYHNLITSTFKVQVLNPSYTIKGNGGEVLAGTDVELEPGNSVQLVAKTATILSIVGVQL